MKHLKNIIEQPNTLECYIVKSVIRSLSEVLSDLKLIYIINHIASNGIYFRCVFRLKHSSKIQFFSPQYISTFRILRNNF